MIPGGHIVKCLSSFIGILAAVDVLSDYSNFFSKAKNYIAADEGRWLLLLAGYSCVYALPTMVQYKLESDLAEVRAENRAKKKRKK